MKKYANIIVRTFIRLSTPSLAWELVTRKEVFMKKTLRKIAMILIIVMLCNMFTGCASMITGTTSGVAYALAGGLIVGAVIGVIVGTVALIKLNKTVKERGPRRTNPYLFENSTLSTTISSLSEGELSSLKVALQSLPEKELDSFIDRLHSLSEEESISLMDSINSFSVQELAAIVETFNSASETEKISSIKSLNHLPGTISLANIVRNAELAISTENAYER
jgi:hypothetical protein